VTFLYFLVNSFLIFARLQKRRAENHGTPSIVVARWLRYLFAFFSLLSRILVLLLMIIKRLLFFLKKKATTRPNKNQHHKQNPNSLASETHDSDMQLILRLSILGSLELLGYAKLSVFI
jgi:hypothetical protein